MTDHEQKLWLKWNTIYKQVLHIKWQYVGTKEKEVIEDMSSQEIGYVLENYSKYLTYDLKRNFEEKREKDLKESPFDAIINEDLGINTKEL